MQKYSMLKENGLLVVFPEAEITSRDYPKFEKKLTRDTLFRKNVVFNLEKVDSVDSQGIVFLLRIKDLVEMNGGYFAIYNPSRHVEWVLKKLQIDKILNLADDVEECFIKMSEYVTEQCSPI